MAMGSKAARRGVLIYTSISIGISLLFLLATIINGQNYPPVARFGGMVWVFILAMIISMPLVIPAVKKRLG